MSGKPPSVLESTASCPIQTHGFPWPRPQPDQAPSPYAELRQRAPLARCTFESGVPVWVATSFDAVIAVLSSRDLSSEHSHPEFPSVFALRQRRDAEGRPPKLSYSALDGPAHRLHRRRIAGEFKRNTIAEKDSWINAQAVAQLQAFVREGPPNDLVTGFARPFVARVIAMVLGLTQDEAEYCARLSDVILGNADRADLVILASKRLRALVSSSIEDRRRAPRDDLLSRLVQQYEADGGFDHDQVLVLVASLITAGLETSAHTIAIGMIMLLRSPEALEDIRADERLMKGAIEEILRLSSVADIVTARVVPEACKIFGKDLRAGTGVVASTASANRDEAVFTRPDEMILDRKERTHIAFGYGPHKCLGRHLARSMVSVATKVLVHNLEDLRFHGDPAWTASKGVMAGVSRLTLSWSATRS